MQKANEQLTVVVPMAGPSSDSFLNSFGVPKPLVDIDGHPMIYKVVQNLQLNLNLNGKFLFVIQRELMKDFDMPKIFDEILQDRWEVVEIDGETRGAAESVLKARDRIDPNSSLIIANSDQIIESQSGNGISSFPKEQVDGALLTFTTTDPECSFVKIDKQGFVTEVAEKRQISTEGVVGVYYWARGDQFITSADEMIAKNITTRGQFFIAPVYNELIAANGIIVAEKVEKMWSLGTPESVYNYLRSR